MKRSILALLLAFSCDSIAEWVEYATGANGDIHYFDDARVGKDGGVVRVWSRTRYKTSVMGASSFQKLTEIDCSKSSATTLQSTFFSDEEWTVPARATNKKRKPEASIKPESPTGRLADRVCED